MKATTAGRNCPDDDQPADLPLSATLRAVPRHVAHVEGKGLPTPRRIRRQRAILTGLSERYAALPESAGGAPPQLLRPVASFGFSMRTTPEDAVAKLVELLDDVDPAWRSFVKVWDGVRGGIQDAVRA